MNVLRKRFGRLLAAHRKRRGITQEALAEAAELSIDMIAKIETGVTGARFPAIERLAQALEIDPAELFTAEIPHSSIRRGAFGEISATLVGLSETDLLWLKGILDAALGRPKIDAASSLKAPKAQWRMAPKSGRQKKR